MNDEQKLNVTFYQKSVVGRVSLEQTPYTFDSKLPEQQNNDDGVIIDMHYRSNFGVNSGFRIENAHGIFVFNGNKGYDAPGRTASDSNALVLIKGKTSKQDLSMVAEYIPPGHGILEGSSLYLDDAIFSAAELKKIYANHSLYSTEHRKLFAANTRFGKDSSFQHAIHSLNIDQVYLAYEEFRERLDVELRMKKNLVVRFPDAKLINRNVDETIQMKL